MIKEVEVIKEIVKEVPVIKEVHIKEDADKIDDTDISMDANGHYQIFDKLHDPDAADE